MLTDLQIASQATLKPIQEIAQQAGIDLKQIELYGNYKAKCDLALTKAPKGKLILVTAINPTPAGEGKTTVSIGLADSLNAINHKAMLALREPSLGPVFGIKGGATGGGYSQVVPMEDINLHFTGDFHAISSANNLLAALIDNHIFQGNQLQIDPSRVIFKRCMDMNDRQLRTILCGVGYNSLREDGFDITSASELMAVLCLANSLSDLKAKINQILIGYTYDDKPVTVLDLGCAGAMSALLKDAIKPNLVQTLAHTPALIHGGPFANIAHGCNSIIATKMALGLADYVVTEAGFGADLGAEKFLDIKCRLGELTPSAVVIVATIRALKMHGGMSKQALNQENVEALKLGLPNLLKHIENMTQVYQLPCVVALNHFASDTQNEIEVVINACQQAGVECSVTKIHQLGAAGGVELANKVVQLCQQPSQFRHAYDLSISLEDKIETLVRKIYGGAGVAYSAKAKKSISKLKEFGYGQYPICVAKTQYSLSDDEKRLAAPTGFEVAVRDVKVSAGAGFVVIYLGQILTMPGLGKQPAAFEIDINEDGKIVGLF